MPIKLQELRTMERTISIETVAGEIEVTYKLAEVTLDWRDKAAQDVLEGLEEQDDRKMFHWATEALSMWVVSWDIMDGEEMYPVTPENIDALPLAIQLDLYRGIYNDNAARPTKSSSKKRGSMKG